MLCGCKKSTVTRTEKRSERKNKIELFDHSDKQGLLETAVLF